MRSTPKMPHSHKNMADALSNTNAIFRGHSYGDFHGDIGQSGQCQKRRPTDGHQNTIRSSTVTIAQDRRPTDAHKTPTKNFSLFKHPGRDEVHVKWPVCDSVEEPHSGTHHILPEPIPGIPPNYAFKKQAENASTDAMLLEVDFRAQWKSHIGNDGQFLATRLPPYKTDYGNVTWHSGRVRKASWMGIGGICFHP